MLDARPRIDFGAMLPGVGVFGGVRRFLELGNELVKRGHRYVLYHPTGEPPQWLEFTGEVRPLAALPAARHQILLCSDPALRRDFAAARADHKFFYCVLEKLDNEREVVRHPGWTILANSSGIRERLWHRHRVRAWPAIGGINLQMFQPQRDGRHDPQCFRILAYGRFSRPRKGTNLVVRGVERFAAAVRRDRTERQVRLVLFDHMGSGNERDPRLELQCNVPHEFHLNPTQAQLSALYCGAQVFVSAERRAGWNNTVAEAMACGLPVICTRSGTRDMAQHRDTAWVLRWRNRFSIAHALRALYRDGNLRTQFVAQGLERIQQFSWPRVASTVEELAFLRLNLGLGQDWPIVHTLGP